MSQGPPRALYPPLEGAKLAVITVALPLATFMQVVDTTIANVAVPTIAGNLGSSYSQGTWIITSYAAMNAVALPLTGRLAQRLGEVRLFMWSTMLFSVCSLLCGLAWSLEALVAFRILQGAAGGPMMPLAQSLLMNNYPRDRQIMAIALWSTTVSVAPVMGPILGGWISDNYHWSWIFLLNVPLGFISAGLVWRTLGKRETPVSRPRWSVVGFSFLALGVASLQIFLDLGKDRSWFESPLIVFLACSAAVFIVLLVCWERRTDSPLLDLGLFRHRNFTVGITLISLGMMLYLGSVVLLPLLLQTRFGYTATWAGIASAPVGLVPVMFTPFVAKLIKKADLRLIIISSFLIFALCMEMRTRFAPGADIGFVILPQTIQGAALALFFVPITTLAFIGIPPERMAGASGLFSCIRTLFTAIGTSVVTTLWERREAVHQARLQSYVDGLNPAAADAAYGLASAGMGQTEALAFMSRQIATQSFIISAGELYRIIALCFLAMIVVTLFAKPDKM
ncbi:MAG: DHA2 family efflux MFS transporter permease subunit [Deltaproteobacteria bacterium]|jgi:DHA2 family multidrug resistance protein|nr:DHA2 family efflux MFS transporter permease subunit [Deltaproteobacteria bacterium]